MKYLELYYKWLETGKIEDDINSSRGGDGGLCNTVIGRQVIYDYFEDGANSTTNAYWGYNGKDVFSYIPAMAYKFTPLRQNMVLLLAGIHGEFDKKKKK